MRLSAEDLIARILHRDGAMLVLDKPAGIAVHKGPKGGVTLDQFLPALQFEKPDLPQLAHRLDRETSGCLVLGRDKPALKRLGAWFASGRIKKTYLALVVGSPQTDRGEIALPLARRSHDKRSWWMKVDPAGDAALTHFCVLARVDGLAFVALLPQTGRTHQLRVHCAAMGWPIAGDRIYGGDRALAVARGLMLHAFALEIPQVSMPASSATATFLRFEAPLPAAFAALAHGLGIDWRDCLTRVASRSSLLEAAGA